MAIRLPYDSRFGPNFPAAYFRVTAFQGDVRSIQYQVKIWANEAARTADKASMEERGFSLPYPQAGTGDILTNCYQHLKSLPQFSSGVDV